MWEKTPWFYTFFFNIPKYRRKIGKYDAWGVTNYGCWEYWEVTNEKPENLKC